VCAQLSFGPPDRLHRSTEFLRLQRIGVRFQSPHFVIYAGNLAVRHEDVPPRSRLGVTVSRRIGSAVVRNRVKRRVREIFRKDVRAKLPTGTAVVVIARGGAGALESSTIRDELSAAARHLSGRIEGRR
jgi:ribonuclease P protein component